MPNGNGRIANCARDSVHVGLGGLNACGMPPPGGAPRRSRPYKPLHLFAPTQHGQHSRLALEVRPAFTCARARRAGRTDLPASSPSRTVGGATCRPCMAPTSSLPEESVGCAGGARQRGWAATQRGRICLRSVGASGPGAARFALRVIAPRGLGSSLARLAASTASHPAGAWALRCRPGLTAPGPYTPRVPSAAWAPSRRLAVAAPVRRRARARLPAPTSVLAKLPPCATALPLRSGSPQAASCADCPGSCGTRARSCLADTYRGGGRSRS